MMTKHSWPADRPIDKLFINGRWRPVESEAFDEIVNPATEALIATVAEGGTEDAEAAISAAKGAFDKGSWSHAHRDHRVDRLRALYDAVVARTDEILALMSLEMGYSIAESAGMLKLGTRLFETYLELARRDPIVPLPPVFGPLPDGRTTLGSAVAVHEPIGVVSAITPYNAGFFLGLVKAVPALLAGNTVVLKPSPFTPLQSFLLAEMIEELDLPPGCFNLVTGGAGVGARLGSDPRVDMVSFTGSEAVGAKVMAQGSATLKKVHLELGGKSALIVRPDADLDRAVASGMAAFVQCGQGCALVTRHIVHNSIREAYLERLVAKTKALTIGDPADPKVNLGPLIRDAARTRCEAFVGTALVEGAVLETGGSRPANIDRGYFFEPTVFSKVDPDSHLAQQEAFGPIVAVIGVDSDEEAIAVANNSKYGLSGGIYSADAGAAFAMARQIRTGTVQINGGPRTPHPHMPFGGFKASGLGREWGDIGYFEFTELKSIGFHAG